MLANPQQMHDFGVRLGSLLQAGDLVVLTGQLGAGKTTLTRGIGEGLGVRGPVQSPTFVISRTHPPEAHGAETLLVHVDGYRLSGVGEFDDLDIDFERSVVVVEWGAGLVPERDHWLEITIERPRGSAAQPESTDDSADEPIEPRELTLDARGERWVGVQW